MCEEKIDADFIREMLKLYIKEFDFRGSLPKFSLHVPSVTIVNTKSNWLGATKISVKQGDALSYQIYIQKRCLVDEKTVRRVALHELLHVVVLVQSDLYQEYLKTRSFAVAKELIAMVHDHDSVVFVGLVNKVNKKLGKNFITPYLDDTYIGNT